MYKKKVLGPAFLLFLFTFSSFAQQKTDSLIYSKNTSDTAVKKKSTADSLNRRSPKIATFRSAVLPGWGQAYNKKYWKIPIIYGALGTTAGIFLYNLKTYRALRQAYIYRSDTIPSNDALIDRKYINLSPESLRTYRNSFRQNVDYTVLVFLIFWGLNVVDATVDAHLKYFDVSNDIGFKLKPVYNYATSSAGITIVFAAKNKKPKALSSL